MSFESILNGIQEKANIASPLGNTLKFDFGGQTIFVDGTGNQNVVSTENKDADCTVHISMDNFLALVKGDLNPMTAFMMGKIKVKGDMGVAMKLQKLLG